MNPAPVDPKFPPKTAILMGLVFVVLGSVPLLASLNIIPADDDSFHVPRWLAAVLSASFPTAGIYMLAHGIANHVGPETRLGLAVYAFGLWFLGAMMICFIGGSAIFLTWEFISPFHGAAGPVEVMGFSFPPDSLMGRILGRTAAGLGALIMDTIVLVVLWNLAKRAFKREREPE